IKAINAVVAFVSSKRQLAISFSSVRSSVEGILKHPLEIKSVSEIKALLPDLVRFSYIPASDLQAKELDANSARTVDYSQAILPPRQPFKFQEQILVLDFVDNATTKKATATPQYGLSPPTLSTTAVKNLIAVRNERFRQAIEELISATPANDDPVNLLVNAGQTFVPVNAAKSSSSTIKSDPNITSSGYERLSINQIISNISTSVWYKDQIVHRLSVEPKIAQTSHLDPPISEDVANAVLKSRRIQNLYCHQVAAITTVRKGRHVVVSTSTASGKSVIYQVPIMSCLEEKPDATAILIFPTKALAQDQKASLEQLFQTTPRFEKLKVATYDGDTPQDIRAEIRENASVILTNFDTLHASILPNEEKWRSFFKRLEILVVDELHYYTGVFGSHVAQILRRLRRLCAAVGNRRTRFISCSATLSNPAEYMSKMFGLDATEVDVVSNDGAPSGSKEYLIWNPPLVDMMDPSLGRRSSLSEASDLMRSLMKEGVRVILFCKIRKICELALKTIKADLANEGRLDILDKVRAYRGGYTREERRRIEQEAFSGQLLGIIATNALELGIDIGALDAVIMLGFPMTVSNFKQQSGRAGRRSRDSLAVMIAEPFPIDQHFVQNPSDLFDNSLDDLILDVDNELVLEAHIQCAAYEIPLTAEDKKWFGPLMTDICRKSLKQDRDGWYHPHPKYLPLPSRHISIRGVQEETYMVVEIIGQEHKRTARMVEEVEVSRALFELYEGAVFMHQGESFVINEVSHDEKVAKAIRSDVNYITSPRLELSVSFVLIFLGSRFFQNPVCFYSGKYEGFSECHSLFRGKTILDAVELETPPWERESIGFWIDLPNSILELLRVHGIDSAAAIHAAEHAFLIQFSLSQDVKTDCRVSKQEDAEEGAHLSTKRNPRYPRLIFYDAAGKTGGVVSRAFDHVQKIMNCARTIVNNCPCSDGCQLCVQSPTCKDANLISSKVGANLILNGLLDSTSTEKGVGSDN
ncbi:hypothetical protein HYPSUDRAFT_131100, partial [Hypholoma sublateritium FD-334 SS-4]